MKYHRNQMNLKVLFAELSGANLVCREVLFVPASCEDDLHHLSGAVQQSRLAWSSPNIILQTN